VANSESNAVGRSIELPARTASRTWIRVFGGYPLKRNIHTDEEFAIERGLPTVVMEGMQTYAYVCQLLVERFGPDWFLGGKLSIAFTKLVLPGDELTVRAVITGRETVDSQSRVLLDVWCENQRGEKVVVGTASGPENIGVR
jgi:acyl dehydratase